MFHFLFKDQCPVNFLRYWNPLCVVITINNRFDLVLITILYFIATISSIIVTNAFGLYTIFLSVMSKVYYRQHISVSKWPEDGVNPKALVRTNNEIVAM